MRQWAMPSVVFCTAYAPPQAFAEILGEGKPHCLLEKPMRGDQLVDALKRGIDKLSQPGA